MYLARVPYRTGDQANAKQDVPYDILSPSLLSLDDMSQDLFEGFMILYLHSSPPTKTCTSAIASPIVSMESLRVLKDSLSAAVSTILSSPTVITALLAVTLVPLLFYIESLGKNPPTRPPVSYPNALKSSDSPKKNNSD